LIFSEIMNPEIFWRYHAYFIWKCIS
jgi:hypothetical protein